MRSWRNSEYGLFFQSVTAKKMKVREEHVPGVGGQGCILFACEIRDLGVFICLKEAANG